MIWFSIMSITGKICFLYSKLCQDLIFDTAVQSTFSALKQARLTSIRPCYKRAMLCTLKNSRRTLLQVAGAPFCSVMFSRCTKIWRQSDFSGFKEPTFCGIYLTKGKVIDMWNQQCFPTPLALLCSDIRRPFLVIRAEWLKFTIKPFKRGKGTMIQKCTNQSHFGIVIGMWYAFVFHGNVGTRILGPHSALKT